MNGNGNIRKRGEVEMAEFLTASILIFIGFALCKIADAITNVADAIRLLSYKQNDRKAHEIRSKLNDDMTWKVGFPPVDEE